VIQRDKGPRALKHRVAEGDVDRVSAVDRALRSQPLESCESDSGPPPPPLRLKVERKGGSRIAFIVVDPGTLIWAVEEVRPRFRTPRLKVERWGGSGIAPVPLIRAPRS
jgi:hypothetical protein